jgi:hypothetical protein
MLTQQLLHRFQVVVSGYQGVARGGRRNARRVRESERSDTYKKFTEEYSMAT